jgi:hypothetical protein
MRVHVLLMQDSYDSDLLGVFADPEAGKAAGDRRFGALERPRWQSDGRGGQMRRVGAQGTYLWLRPAEVSG